MGRGNWRTRIKGRLDPFDPRSREALNKFIFAGYCLELDKDGAYTEWLEGKAFAKDAADFETAQNSPHLYLGIHQTFKGPSLFDQIDHKYNHHLK